MSGTVYATITQLVPAEIGSIITQAEAEAMGLGWESEDVCYHLYPKGQENSGVPRAVIRFDFERYWTRRRCWQLETAGCQHPRWFLRQQNAIQAALEGWNAGRLEVILPTALEDFAKLCKNVHLSFGACEMIPPDWFRDHACDWYSFTATYTPYDGVLHTMSRPFSVRAGRWMDHQHDVLWWCLMAAYRWRPTFPAWLEEQEDALQGHTDEQLRQDYAEDTSVVRELREFFGPDYRRFLLAALNY